MARTNAVRFAPALWLALFAGQAAHAFDATQPWGDSPWRARLQLSSLDGLTTDAPRLGSSRVLSANLLGDYYLTGSGLSGLHGGLRATGGMLVGPMSLSQSSAGLALGQGSRFAVGQRGLRLLSPFADSLEPSMTLSYFGIGYSAQLHRSGLAFSADLGLTSGLGGLRLGRSSAQGVEEALRDLRFKPLLQLGLAYNY